MSKFNIFYLPLVQNFLDKFLILYIIWKGLMVGGGGVHQFYISSDTTTKLIECLCNPDGREQKNNLSLFTQLSNILNYFTK